MKSTGNKPNTHNRELGVYILDMMIALAVSANLLWAAVPTYSYVVHKNDIKSVTNRLFMSLNNARSEALRRSSSIRICPSANGSSCRNDGDWSDGWLVFEDVNANNAPGSAEIIEFIYELDGNVDVQVSTSLSDFVQFQPTGIAVGSSGNTGEFKLCHADSNSYSTAVSISVTGQVNHVNHTQTNCNPFY